MLQVPPRSATPRLAILGRFRLSADGGLVAPVSNRRARALLGYLCFTGPEGATREQLSGLLWSDRGELQARASLRQCVLELRAALQAHGLDLLDVRRDSIALNAGAATSDVGELLAALAGDDGARVAELVAAIGRGQLLEEAEIPGLFFEWREVQRSWLEDRIASGVQRHVEALESAGDWRGVKALAEAYLHRDPVNEPVVAAAMRADAALGSTTAAHRRFRVLQAALERDFGAAPVGMAREALAALGVPRAEQPAPAGPSDAPAPRARATEGPPLVLVAAFEDHAEGRAPLAATLREEVVAGLSRFRELRVITDPQPIGALQDEASRTWLDYVLGGQVRAAAGGWRLVVQLVRAEDRHVMWSETLAVEGLELDLLGGIDSLVAKVVGAVLPTISADLARQAEHAPGDIHRRFALAREDAHAPESHADARAAAAALEAVIEADPRFAPAYLPLATLLNTDYCYTLAGSAGEAERGRALALAKKGLSLDRGHVHGYTVTGWCYLRLRRWEPAQAHFEQAMALNPFDALRVMEVGFGCVFLGELERARSLLDRCLLLNPAPDDKFFADLGLLELMRGDHERAASYFDLIAHPHIWAEVYAAINAVEAGAGGREESEAALRRIASIWPDGRPFTQEAVIGWIASHHPFKAPEAEAVFLKGAGAMFSRARAEPELAASAPR